MTEAADEQLTVLWASELEQRSRDAEEGKVRTVEWEVAQDQILSELAAKRASSERAKLR